jgi:hypothetical protein
LTRSMIVGVAISSRSLVMVTEVVIVLRSVVWNYGVAGIVRRWERRGQERSMRWGLEHMRWYVTCYGIGGSCRSRSSLSGLRRTTWWSRHCCNNTIARLPRVEKCSFTIKQACMLAQKKLIMQRCLWRSFSESLNQACSRT